MSFWETVKGNHLADVLMHTLPDIVDELQNVTRKLQERNVKRTQYVMKVPYGFLEDYITAEIEAGNYYVDTIPVGTHFLVVMEKVEKL